MSALLMGKVWQLADLGRSERDVLLALADDAKDDGTASDPGVPYLVWKTELGKSTVHTALRGLEGKALIVPVARGGGRGKVTEYRLTLENGSGKEPFVHENGAISALNGPDSGPFPELNRPDSGPFSLACRQGGNLKPLEQEQEQRHIQQAWLDHCPPLQHHGLAYFATARFATAAKAALKVYPAEAIAKAIDNYAAVLSSSAHYWKHRWTIIDFLNRGLDRFEDAADPLSNFRTGPSSAAPDLSPYEGIDDVV